MATLANVYKLRDTDTIVFYRVLEEGSHEVKQNKGEAATIEEIKTRLHDLYPDIVFLPQIAFSKEVICRDATWEGKERNLFAAWKAVIEHQGYVCLEASAISDRDLLYDGLTPDQPAQVIGTPWDDNGERVLVEVNRRGQEELVSYHPCQLVFVKREGTP